MNQKATDRAALARSEGLIARELSGELLIYDSDRDKAHCLNQTAALIWKYCDGKTTVTSMAHQLGRELKADCVDENVVWYALDQLGKDHLLEEIVAPPAVLRGMSRRQMVRVLGVAAVVAVPIVRRLLLRLWWRQPPACHRASLAERAANAVVACEAAALAPSSFGSAYQSGAGWSIQAAPDFR